MHEPGEGHNLFASLATLKEAARAMCDALPDPENLFPCQTCGRESQEDELKGVVEVKDNGVLSLTGCWQCTHTDHITQLKASTKEAESALVKALFPPKT